MNIRFFIAIIFVALCLNSYPQSSFELLIQNEIDQVPAGLLEDNAGNYYCSIYNSQKSGIIKINNSGQVIDSVFFTNPINGNCYIGELLDAGTGHFVGFGSYNVDSTFHLWFVKFDYDFNIVTESIIQVPGKLEGNFIHSLRNSSGNYIVTATYDQPYFIDSDLLVYEINENGEKLKENYWGTSSLGNKNIWDIEERAPGRYYFTSNALNLNQKSSNYIYELDSNLMPDGPYYIGWDIEYYNDLKFINDSTFIYSGLKHFPNGNETQIGLLKLDIMYNQLDSAHYGKWGNDTIDYPAFHNNLSFIDPDKIFYGGTSNLNIINPFFSYSPSWILLVKINNNFETLWENYYGGDACYNLWQIFATQDGGCILAGTRYDYLTQNQERDVYLLKVNEDGLITWTYNVPEETKQAILFPNPGKDEINIKSIADKLIFELYDMAGQKVISKEIDKEDWINTAGLKAGMYSYVIYEEGRKVVESGMWVKK